MQNREVPVGNLPIFFSSLRLAEAGRTCPEVRGGRQGAEHGQPSAGRRRRSHGPGAGCGARGAGAEHGRRGRGAQDAKRGTRGRGRGHGARGHGHGGTGTGARGAGRRTQNAERRTRATGRGQQNTGNGGTKCRRRGIGDGAQAPVHGPQRDCIHPPGLATTCRDRSQPGAIRRGPHPTCRAYESESRRCRRARRTCCCRAAPRPT